MTTARSPIRTLKAQANMMAATLKAVERGERIPQDAAGKLAEARAKRADVKFMVGIDDKQFVMSMTWADIKQWSEPAIAKTIFNAMRHERKFEKETVH
jgi:hypothetical protein